MLKQHFDKHYTLPEAEMFARLRSLESRIYKRFTLFCVFQNGFEHLRKEIVMLWSYRTFFFLKICDRGEMLVTSICISSV